LVVRSFGAGITERYSTSYWIASAVAALAPPAIWPLMRSHIGLGLTFLRDDEGGRMSSEST
jgi:hypothetical protein